MAIEQFGNFMFDPFSVVSVEPHGEGALVTISDAKGKHKELEIDAGALKSFREWVAERGK